MLKNYFKIGLRNLIKQRGYTIINIGGLSLGMLSCLLIFLWVQDEINFDSFHKNKDRLYLIVSKGADGIWSSSSPWALAPVLKNDFPEIERASRFYYENVLIKCNINSFYESAAFVDPDFLKMFSFQLIKGNINTALINRESVVISEKVAQKYFPNENPVGKAIKIDNKSELRITGVFENVGANSTLTFDLLVPIINLGEDRLATWSSEAPAFVLLRDNSDISLLQKKIAGTTKKYDTRTNNNPTVNGLEHFKRIHLYDLNNTGPILYVYIFSAVALIILIVACINFINLMTARSLVRSKEIGLRKVAGAGKKHISLQFYIETFLLSVFAMFLAFLIAVIALPFFNDLTAKQIQINILTNPFLLISCAFIIILTTLLAGTYPAMFLSSFHPLKIIRYPAKGFSKSKLRWFLVVVQFVVTVILITLTITMNRQFNYIQNLDLGFNRAQVISIPLNNDVRNKYEVIKNNLKQLPGIINISTANNNPVNIGYANPVYWEGRGPDQYESMYYLSTDYDFLKTFEIKLLEGRNFSKDYSTDSLNYIVNEAAVKHMKMNSPLGKSFSIWNFKGKLIGVVKDFHFRSLHNEIAPLVITLLPFMPPDKVFIRIESKNVRATLDSIEEVWKNFVPNYPFQYQFLDESFKNQYIEEEKIKLLFQCFSVIAIFISCIGLLGLAAFIAQGRKKEIGIRKVVGASTMNVIGSALKEFVKWLLISNVIAIPIGYYIMNKWLENFAYRIEITWWMFALSGGIALLIALATVSIQAIKAATANPVEALKYE